MSTIYLCIVIFLLCLAVFDLFVGVSNDAVNFLQSAIGAKVAKFRTVLIIASCGVVLGAIMSSGMMDIARHGIMSPDHFTFEEVMTLFLAVMVTDVIVLDVFNTLGMPTSTTVSLVFELLGGAFILSTLKMWGDPSLNYSVLLNSDKALEVIIGIFASVAIAFFFGVIVMWISRVVFTFNYKKHSRYSIAIFGGIAFTALSYFILMKGLGKSPYLPAEWRDYISDNIGMLLVVTFVASAIVMEFLHLCRINIFKFTVLMGTFGLAMAFAGNDLVNFIGVPLAGLSSYQDYMANANGAAPDAFMMTSLMESAKTTPVFLLIAGFVMIIAMATSKKAQNVIKTSVDLSRQDEGDEMFGSSSAARVIVRNCQNADSWLNHFLPQGLKNWINSRFNKNDVELEESAAFDVVRAAVNLVLASMLITIGTNLKLPLSTTYVTFMVAMGTSLADRAWSRQSAVFRITGVLSVIGGWFITAGVAFIVCYLVTCIMFFGHFPAMAIGIVVAIVFLVRSNIKQAKKSAQDNQDNLFVQIMRSRDENNNWTLLTKHVRLYSRMQLAFVADCYRQVTDAFFREEYRPLKKASSRIEEQRNQLKRQRRKEVLALRRVNHMLSIERNTWYFLSIGALNQMLYCLKRITEPCREHIGNNFLPVNSEYITPFMAFRKEILRLFDRAYILLDDSRVDEAGMNDSPEELRADATALQRQLSGYRKTIIDDIQNRPVNLESMILFLSLVQESQELLSNLRHMIRGYAKFCE